MNDQATILRRKFSRNSRSLSFTSGKGGVGKTNIVVNLSMHLAKMGKKVFVIDADLGLANIDILLNLAPEYTIEDVLTGNKHINDIIIEGPLGIHVLPASSGISEMQSLSGRQQMSMLSELSNLKTKYDYILIDTGAGIASNVLRFNAAADEICVVTNPEPTAITDAYALMKIMSSKYQVHRFSLIVNQSEVHEARDVYDRLVRVLNEFLTVKLELLGNIPRDPNFVKAVKRQKPLSLLLPNSPPSKAFSKMARRIASNFGESEAEANKNSFWKKLVNWKGQ
ncbi:MAG: MinD/ParA family protein [Proteobacteria bacterium]|nr:MinD/ParA family protein [Pseudomonadota bacterium]